MSGSIDDHTTTICYAYLETYVGYYLAIGADVRGR